MLRKRDRQCGNDAASRRRVAGDVLLCGTCLDARGIGDVELIDMPRIAALRDRVWSGVEARFGAGVVLNGHPDLRLPSTLNCSFIGASGGEILGGLAGVAATAVNDRVALFALAPSLGEVESLVTQPCTTTHHCLTREERARRGISDAMLGLSIGLEDAEDLIADLHQALG